MKRTIGVACLVAASTAWPAPTDKQLKTCAEYSQTAEEIMEVRQLGARQRVVMQAMSDVESSKAQRDLIVDTVKRAYEKPQMNTKSFREKVTRQFGDDAYTRCLHGMEQVNR